MHITLVPQQCFERILPFLDLPNQHSLLLTCRTLFLRVVPVLYRSPFRAILAFDGWTLETDSSPIHGHLHHRHPSPQTSASSASSSPASTTSAASTDTALTIHTAQVGHRVSKPPVVRTATQLHYQHHERQPSPQQRQQHRQSLHQHHQHFQQQLQQPHHPSPHPHSHQRSMSDSQSMPALKSKGSRSNSHTGPRQIGYTPLEQLKLAKLARLLQLFIACTSVQARLPALRYPGYGQQWIRPPCKVDYLEYYLDQDDGEVMIQCFHLLFADLVRCHWEDGHPQAPDAEAFKVLDQIQREFIGHNASTVRAVAVSAASLGQILTPLVHQLASLVRLKLTDMDLDLDQPPIQPQPQQQHSHQSSAGPREDTLDFLKSHRMLFGPILRNVVFVGGGGRPLPAASAPPSHAMPPTPTSPSAPAFRTTPAIPTRHQALSTLMEAFRHPHKVDASSWKDMFQLYDKLSPAQLRVLRLPLDSTLPLSSSNASSARLMGFLEICRQLEELQTPIQRGDVYHWAYLEKKANLISAPILAGSRTKRLPRMRRLCLSGPLSDMIDVVHDAAFAFQDTLRDLEARSSQRIWQPSTVEFNWWMPRLTRLCLEGDISLYFSLYSLGWCPQLESLSLTLPLTGTKRIMAGPSSSSASSSHSHYSSNSNNNGGHPLHHQQPHPHQRDHDPGSGLLLYIRAQEMYRIGSLKYLKSLTLRGPWHIPDMALRRIGDRCLSLSELRLERTVGTTIGGLLLALEQMKRLGTLSLKLDVVDLDLVHLATKQMPFLSSCHVVNSRKE